MGLPRKNFRALNVLLWTLIKVIYINLFRKREHLGDSVALEHKRGLWPALVFMPGEIDTPRFTYSGVNDPPRFILGWLTHQGLFWGEWPNEVYSGDFYPPGFLFPERLTHQGLHILERLNHQGLFWRDWPIKAYSGEIDPPKFILKRLTHLGLFWRDWPTNLYSGVNTHQSLFWRDWPT